MTGKFLGNIDAIEFGKMIDSPFLIGFFFRFRIKTCKNEPCKTYAAEITSKRTEDVYRMLTNANVNYVSELKNKSVEITLENDIVKDFRLL